MELSRRLSVAMVKGLAAILVMMITVAGVSADAGGGRFSIQNARSLLVGGVYRISADVDYELGPQARQALESGVPLVLELQVEVFQRRDWLWDEVVADVRQRHELRYHALSRRYLITNVASGAQASYARLSDALEAIGTVYDLPILDQRLLSSPADHRIRIRAGLDIEALPTPIRLWAYVSSDWRVDSPWYEWSLRH
jgi:hypothetical protein